MSNIQYFTDGEQATAAVLNRPLKDLEMKSQYLSEKQFDINRENNREIYAGSGFIEWGGYRTDNHVNEGITTAGIPNTVTLGGSTWSGSFTNNLKPLVNVSGIKLRLDGLESIMYPDAEHFENTIMLPEAPTLIQSNNVELENDYKAGDFILLNGDNLNEQVKNGTFDDNIDNWTARGDNANIEYDSDNNALKIIVPEDSPYQGAIATQTIKLIRNATYNFSLDVIDSDRTISAIITRHGSTSQIHSRVSTKENGASKIEFSFKAKYDTCVIVLESDSTNNAKNFVIDNISLKMQKTIVNSHLNKSANTNIIESRDFLARDSVSRQDLVFLEVWPERITDKGMVYPYGNIQYRGANIYGLSNIAEGEFSGADTYSLFGNWQEAGDIIGKGYKWSELSNLEKLRMASNKEHNIYETKWGTIQINYRIRVVKGLSSKWSNIQPNKSSAIYQEDGINDRIAIKAGAVSILSDFTSSGSDNHYYGARSDDFGVGEAYSTNNENLSYGNKSYYLPLMKIQRLNNGAYHPIFNRAGSCEYNDGNNFFNTDVNIEKIMDCFTESGETTLSARPDQQRFNIITPKNIEDIRFFAKKQEISNILETSINNCIKYSLRGKEYITITKKINLNNIKYDYDNIECTFFTNGSTGLYRGHFYGTTYNNERDAIFGKAKNTKNNWNNAYGIMGVNNETGENNIIYGDISGSNYRNYPESANFLATFCDDIKDGKWYKVKDNCTIYLLVTEKEKSVQCFNNFDTCDIIGNPKYYPTSWENGFEGKPVIKKNNGQRQFPIDTRSGKRLEVYFSAKQIGGHDIYVLKGDGSGWYRANTEDNELTTSHDLVRSKSYYDINDPEALGYDDLDDAMERIIILEFYNTRTQIVERDINTQVIEKVSSKAIRLKSSNSSLGALLTNDLITKLPISGSSDTQRINIENFTINSENKLWNYETGFPSHNSFRDRLTFNDYPAIKILPYLSTINNVYHLTIIFKELIWDSGKDSLGDLSITEIDTSLDDVSVVKDEYYILKGKFDGLVFKATQTNDNLDIATHGIIINEDKTISLKNKGYIDFGKVWNGNGWGDNNLFEIVDNGDVIKDDNNNDIIIGQKTINLNILK